MARSRLAPLVGLLLVVALLLGALWLRGTSDGDQGRPRDPAAASVTTAGRAASSGTPGASPGSMAPSRPATRSTEPRDTSGLPVVALADLPREAAETVRLLDAGGPFPYPGKDGSTYRNLNQVLPRQPEGYYREYTVKTPGSADRGARRIVAGRQGELYWTDDHYETFARIRR